MAKILVACSIPNGLHLDLCEKRQFIEPTSGGGSRSFEQYVRIPGKRVTVHGPRRVVPLDPSLPRIIGNSYVLTEIDEAHWTEWLAQGGAESDAVKNHCLFAVSKGQSYAEGKAKELKAKSGFEPLDVDGVDGKDARIPRRQPGVGKIETATTSSE
jgi:hypothetical protein